MRTYTLLRTVSRSLPSSLRLMRTYTSSSASPSTLESTLRASLLARPPHIIHDYLSPTPSHLLNLTLADFLPQKPTPTSASTSDEHDTASSSTPYPLPGRHDEHALPPAHHLVYFPAQLPLSALLPDGTDDLHSPGDPFTRRLWGGGSLTFNTDKPYILDLDCTRAVCVERISDVKVRGKEGEEKVVVEVERRVAGVGKKLSDRAHDSFDEEWRVRMGERVAELAAQDLAAVGGMDGIGVVERRNLVFLREGEVVKGERVVKAPHVPDYSVTLTPTPHFLFRFSALSFNAHKIHFDPSYARDVEGYRGPLVHGPLTLVMMMEVLSSQLQPGEMVKSFEYRNLAPLLVDEECRICVKLVGDRRWEVWIEGQEGGLAVRGKAVIGRVDESLLEGY